MSTFTSTERIELDVPADQVELAKKHGALYAAERGVWYVPPGRDPLDFGAWLRFDFPNTRASSYFVAEAAASCWKCGNSTRVFGFLMPSGHETLEAYEEHESRSEWLRHDGPLFVHVVCWLAPKVVDRMRSLAPNYRFGFSQAAAITAWMNHCDSCGEKQSDFELFQKPGSAFLPLDAAQASRIRLRHIQEPFAGTASSVFVENIIEHMIVQCESEPDAKSATAAS